MYIYIYIHTYAFRYVCIRICMCRFEIEVGKFRLDITDRGTAVNISAKVGCDGQRTLVSVEAGKAALLLLGSVSDRGPFLRLRFWGSTLSCIHGSGVG